MRPVNKNIRQKLINTLPLLISIIGFVSSHIFHVTFVYLPADSSFHFNLVTINALFGGFLFTGLSLMVGFLDNAIINKLKGTDIIKRRNQHIIKGISYSVISVCASLLFILYPETQNPSKAFVRTVLCNFEITYMFFGIAYFLLSLKEISSLVEKLYSGKNHNQETLDKIDQSLNNGKK